MTPCNEFRRFCFEFWNCLMVFKWVFVHAKLFCVIWYHHLVFVYSVTYNAISKTSSGRVMIMSLDIFSFWIICKTHSYQTFFSLPVFACVVERLSVFLGHLPWLSFLASPIASAYSRRGLWPFSCPVPVAHYSNIITSPEIHHLDTSIETMTIMTDSDGL